MKLVDILNIDRRFCDTSHLNSGAVAENVMHFRSRDDRWR